MQERVCEMNQSPFYDVAKKASAEMAEHNGWEVAEKFNACDEEINATKNGVAVFDVSFYSRIRVDGTDSQPFFESLLKEGAVPVIPERQANVKFKDLDAIDTLIQHQGKNYLIVTQASNHQSFLDSLTSLAESHQVNISDETFSTAMVSICGPSALKLMKDKFPIDIQHLEPGDLVAASLFFMKFVISIDKEHQRIMVILPSKMASQAWDMLQKYGEQYNIQPAGYKTWQALFA